MMRITESPLRPAQRKWMLFLALLSAAVVVAGLIGSIASAQSAADEERGKAVYDHWCAPCHAPGPGHPGTQGLAIKYRGTETPAEIEARTDLTPAVIEVFVRQGVLAMAPFRKTEITDAELADLSAYLSK